VKGASVFFALLPRISAARPLSTGPVVQSGFWYDRIPSSPPPMTRRLLSLLLLVLLPGCLRSPADDLIGTWRAEYSPPSGKRSADVLLQSVELEFQADGRLIVRRQVRVGGEDEEIRVEEEAVQWKYLGAEGPALLISLIREHGGEQQKIRAEIEFEGDNRKEFTYTEPHRIRNQTVNTGEPLGPMVFERIRN